MSNDKAAFWTYLAEQWLQRETTKEERWYQATGTAVVVPTDLFDERQREEARRLALWALDYDEDHPDYDLYYKQFLRALKWGASK